MIKYKSVIETIETNEIESVTCDCCKKPIEGQKLKCNEFCKFYHEGGFFSDYPGDLAAIEFELCEDCMKELFGGFARVRSLN